jgi:hypothetical protein
MTNSDQLPGAVLRREAVVYAYQSTQTRVQTKLEGHVASTNCCAGRRRLVQEDCGRYVEWVGRLELGGCVLRAGRNSPPAVSAGNCRSPRAPGTCSQMSGSADLVRRQSRRSQSG